MNDQPITFYPADRAVGQNRLKSALGHRATKAAGQMSRRTLVRSLMVVDRLSKAEAQLLADQILAGGAV